MSLPEPGPGYYSVEAPYAELLRSVGLADARSVFENPKIEVWRSIRERENCILDHDAGRLHIKRNKPGYRGVNDEAAALGLLKKADVPTVPLVGAGMLNDFRGFLITDDLAGYNDSEKLVAGGTPFEKLLEPTARLAGKLHKGGLHHRDLYLCHFYARTDGDVELALMDAGRVKPLPKWFTRRWIVKDLAQFVYSVQQLGVDLPTVDRWLKIYAESGAEEMSALVRRAIFSKVKSIARHDARLRQREPTRNVAIDR